VFKSNAYTGSRKSFYGCGILRFSKAGFGIIGVNTLDSVPSESESKRNRTIHVNVLHTHNRFLSYVRL
jgi:hypothetical protein